MTVVFDNIARFPVCSICYWERSFEPLSTAFHCVFSFLASLSLNGSAIRQCTFLIPMSSRCLTSQLLDHETALLFHSVVLFLRSTLKVVELIQFSFNYYQHLVSFFLTFAVILSASYIWHMFLIGSLDSDLIIISTLTIISLYLVPLHLMWILTCLGLNFTI